MKSRALTYLCLCVLALSPVMCGKNKSTNPTQSQYAVYDYSDTVALRRHSRRQRPHSDFRRKPGQSASFLDNA